MSAVSRRALLLGSAAVALAAPAATAVPAPAAPEMNFTISGYVPAGYLDCDSLYHFPADPAGWLESLPGGGHRLLNRYGETLDEEGIEAADATPLHDGQIIAIGRAEDYGEAELTALPRPLGSPPGAEAKAFTCTREWPVGAQSAFDVDDEYCCGDNFGDLLASMEAGETRTIRFVSWTYHNFRYRAAGTLEPVGPAPLGQLVSPTTSEAATGAEAT